MGTERANSIRLHIRRGAGEHACTLLHGELDEDAAHTTGRRVDQRRVTRSEREGRDSQVVSGHALQRQRACGRRVDPVRHDEAAVGLHRDLLRVRAHRVGPRDALTDLAIGDRPDPLEPVPARQRHRVETAAVIGVDEVHAGVLHVDDDLSGPGGRGVDVDVLEDLGTTGGSEADRLHGLTS